MYGKPHVHKTKKPLSLWQVRKKDRKHTYNAGGRLSLECSVLNVKKNKSKCKPKGTAALIREYKESLFLGFFFCN